MHQVQVSSHQHRKNAIQQSNVLRTHRVLFREDYIDLEVKVIDSKYLLYRLENMRTRPGQVFAEQEQKLGKDYFAKNQENAKAQQLQHEILVKLAKENKANIYNELGEKAEQGEPLIATVDGIIVDGNRRLSALREHLDSDPVRYSKFRFIEVAILPSDATAEQISRFEVQIQIRKDLKLGYTWIAEALGLRNQFNNYALSPKEIAGIWNEDEKMIDERLTALNLADEYLEWLGKPQDYEKVNDLEFAITAAAKELKKNKDKLTENELTVQRLVMFSVFASEISGRKLMIAADSTKIASRVAAKLLDQGIVSVRDAAIGEGPAIAGLPVKPNAGSVQNVSPTISVDFFLDPKNAQDIADIAVDVKTELDDEGKIQKVGNTIRDAATKASTGLQSAYENRKKGDADTFTPSFIALANVVHATAGLMEHCLQADLTADSISVEGKATLASYPGPRLKTFEDAVSKLEKILAELKKL
jgi:hypothetical protein